MVYEQSESCLAFFSCTFTHYTFHLTHTQTRIDWLHLKNSLSDPSRFTPCCLDYLNLVQT